MRNIVHVGAGGESRSANDTIYHYFEPREDGHLSKVSTKQNVNVYPVALSDYKGTATLNLTKKLSCSSFLEPNMELLKELQPNDWDRFEVSDRIEVQVDRLDNLLDSDTAINKLIIDTQGSELNVLKGCGDLLNNTHTIVCEVEYVELYKDQPLFSDVLEYLEPFGFKHKGFSRQVKWGSGSNIFADAIFKK